MVSSTPQRKTPQGSAFANRTLNMLMVLGVVSVLVVPCRFVSAQILQTERVQRLTPIVRGSTSSKSAFAKSNQDEVAIKTLEKRIDALKKNAAAEKDEEKKQKIEKQIVELTKAVTKIQSDLAKKKVEQKKKLDEQRKKAAEAAKKRREEMRRKEIANLKIYLKQRDIAPSAEGVKKFLLQITNKERDWSIARQLIEKLGSASYTDRTAAQHELLKLPEVPIELLREASKSPDREKAFRARMILKNAIPLRRETVVKTLRAIELLKLGGMVPEVFKTVQLFQDEKNVVRAAKRALGEVTTTDDINFLVSQMGTETIPQLTDIAIYSLRLMEEKSLAEKFDAWQKDAEITETIRLEAALGLADLGDRRALGALLNLMKSSESTSIRSRSNIALRKFTNQKFKFSAFDKPKVRDEKIKQWEDWIAKSGSDAKIFFPLHSVRLTNSHLNGHTLLAFGYRNKVVEYDESMTEIWSYDCQGPWSAEKMENGNVLIAEYRKNRVIEVSPEKEIVREFAATGPLNARPLENGNYLISSYSSRKILEVDTEGKTVWEFTGKSMVPDAVRLEDGTTLVSEYQSVCIVDADGKRIWEVTNADIKGLNQVMGIQALENGNVLITSMAGYVVEVDKETKKEIWRHNCNRPSDAFRLENGNTLITEADKFIEVDREGKVLWKQTGANYGTARR